MDLTYSPHGNLTPSLEFLFKVPAQSTEVVGLRGALTMDESRPTQPKPWLRIVLGVGNEELVKVLLWLTLSATGYSNNRAYRLPSHRRFVSQVILSCQRRSAAIQTRKQL